MRPNPTEFHIPMTGVAMRVLTGERNDRGIGWYKADNPMQAAVVARPGVAAAIKEATRDHYPPGEPYQGSYTLTLDVDDLIEVTEFFDSLDLGFFEDGAYRALRKMESECERMADPRGYWGWMHDFVARHERRREREREE